MNDTLQQVNDDLVTIIQELVAVGDELSEIVEFYENDPVIVALETERYNSRLPLYAESKERAWSADRLREQWDNMIGTLQEQKLIGPFIDENTDVLFELEIVDETWNATEKA